MAESRWRMTLMRRHRLLQAGAARASSAAE
jgi:hypothetical protein